MWETIKQKVKEGWKAVVAFAIPALIGVLAGAIDALGDWLATQSGAWVGIAVGILSSIGVWLKANAPQA